MKTHYSVLGIRPTATEAEIKAAYHKIARLKHPDLKGSDATKEDEDAFAEINAAGQTLSDHAERMAYDRLLELMTDKCPECKGSGAVLGKKYATKTCPVCEGVGRKER